MRIPGSRTPDQVGREFARHAMRREDVALRALEIAEFRWRCDLIAFRVAACGCSEARRPKQSSIEGTFSDVAQHLRWNERRDVLASLKALPDVRAGDRWQQGILPGTGGVALAADDDDASELLHPRPPVPFVGFAQDVRPDHEREPQRGMLRGEMLQRPCGLR